MSESQGTAPATSPQKEQRATITCHENPKCLKVTPDPLRVNQNLGETAAWECEGNKRFVIVFMDETPLDRWMYDQANAKNLSPRQGVPHQKPFKYTVALEDYPPIDPDLIVEP